MVKVLVVGQTPPPFGGQAMMIQQLLDGQFQNIKLYHVRMAFSSDMNEIGRFRIGKIFHLIEVIVKTIWKRFRYGINVLYYPPAGPNRVPIYRDIAILILTRHFFSRTIFHFHAGGISEFIPTLTIIERWLASIAYYNSDCAIRLSKFNPEDGKNLKARKEVIIPNGVMDHNHNNIVAERNAKILTILFVGTIFPSKGVEVLLDACQILNINNMQFKLELMGQFYSPEYEKKVKEQITSSKLSPCVKILGVKTDEAKWQIFRKADVFCLPSFFDTFGLVLVEAMQFEIPVVATQVGGIPSVVSDDENGYLVPVNDAEAVAEKLRLLLDNTDKRKAMGKRGREIYLQNFTLEKWYSRMEKVLYDTGSI